MEINPKIQQVSVDPVHGFFFLHFLASSVMAAVSSPQAFETGFINAQNIINRELAKFENWKRSIPLMTETIKQAYFARMRDRVFAELNTLAKVNQPKPKENQP